MQLEIIPKIRINKLERSRQKGRVVQGWASTTISCFHPLPAHAALLMGGTGSKQLVSEPQTSCHSGLSQLFPTGSAKSLHIHNCSHETAKADPSFHRLLFWVFIFLVQTKLIAKIRQSSKAMSLGMGSRRFQANSSSFRGAGALMALWNRPGQPKPCMLSQQSSENTLALEKALREALK